MTCPRCDGLMVREQYDDLEFDSAGYEISGGAVSIAARLSML